MAQAHSHSPAAPRIVLGAQAIGLLTHATPATYKRDLTEIYLTQPNLFAHASFFGSRLNAQATVNFEGLTLARGELNAGSWGEGYIDRRHPHTYLHEALLTAEATAAGFAVSLTAGRGFAPFGSDDPMVRPFVKYPVNHHLAHILERWVLAGAIRRGPLMFEAGLFNGDEPIGPDALGQLDRFGDSWASRVTIVPVAGLEIAGSYALAASPELPWGGGFDHAKRHVGARFARDLSSRTRVYALAEVMRTANVAFNERLGRRDEAYVFRGFLTETAVRHDAWSVAARLERTTRPEEERTDDPFRSPKPHPNLRLHGITRFTNVSVAIGRDAALGRLGFAPFVEVVRSHAAPTTEPALFTPHELWGTDVLWSLSAGVRVGAGLKHNRMGRYGAAVLQ